MAGANEVAAGSAAGSLPFDPTPAELEDIILLQSYRQPSGLDLKTMAQGKLAQVFSLC